MKKVYIPTEEELERMHYLIGDYMYTYYKVKAIESLIVDGVNYPNKGILKSAYKYLKEDPDIAHAIGMMFPEEIKYSEMAQDDTLLCQKLISEEEDTSIYRLDNLAYFENGILVLDNCSVVDKTINTLTSKLPSNPKYRFTYVNSSLLDNIFARKLTTFSRKLITIEPAYVLTSGFNSKRDEEEHLMFGLREYADRYDMRLYPRRDEKEVKKLIKCINHNKDNLY